MVGLDRTHGAVVRHPRHDLSRRVPVDAPAHARRGYRPRGGRDRRPCRVGTVAGSTGLVDALMRKLPGKRHSTKPKLAPGHPDHGIPGQIKIINGDGLRLPPQGFGLLNLAAG
jgi:hypothetical protein